LISISNPRIQVMDTLSKLSHDSDEEVALGAIFGLGLIGAGTNNSRVANMLRGLASYYYKEPNHLFMVRISQGLVYLGKGTMTLAPYHFDRMVMCQTAIAGLLTALHSCLDLKNSKSCALSNFFFPLYDIIFFSSLCYFFHDILDFLIWFFWF
jgi:26S proteasome regulatory subunit N1